MSNHPDRPLDSEGVRVLDEYLRAISFRCEVIYRGQLCDTWWTDISGSGHVNFHVLCHGTCWLRLPGLAAPLRVEEGDIVVLPHDSPHLLMSAPDVAADYKSVSAPHAVPPDRAQPGTAFVCGYLVVDRHARRLLLSMLPQYLVIRSRHDSGAANMRALIDLLFAEAQRAHGVGTTAVLDRLADALMFCVIRHAAAAYASPAGLLAALRDGHMRAALGAICDEPQRAWTVDTLAERACLSRSAFAERFHALLGSTPMDFLTEWRMQLARRWFEQDRLSVAEVAARCGYQSEAAFSKAFKRVVGVGPGEFRRARHLTPPADRN